VIRGRWPEAEPFIRQDAEWACAYAQTVIGGRWPEAEPVIQQDPQSAFFYALEVIGGRWPEAEPVIMKNPQWARHYAEKVIKGRWPEAEPYIMKSRRYASWYKKAFPGKLKENDDDLFAPSDRVQREIEDYNHPLKNVGRCDKTDYDMLTNEIDYTINKLGQNPNEDELSAVVDQLEYSLDPALVKFLDAVLAGAIAVDSDRFNRSLVQALRDGEQRYGTEPRPAVHAAVDALVRGWKDVSRMQDRRAELILGQNR